MELTTRVRQVSAQPSARAVHFHSGIEFLGECATCYRKPVSCLDCWAQCMQSGFGTVTQVAVWVQKPLRGSPRLKPAWISRPFQIRPRDTATRKKSVAQRPLLFPRSLWARRRRSLPAPSWSRASAGIWKMSLEQA